MGTKYTEAFFSPNGNYNCETIRLWCQEESEPFKRGLVHETQREVLSSWLQVV